MIRYIPFVLLFASACLFAADSQNEEEQKQAKTEEEAESKLSEVDQIALSKSFSGKLELQKSEDNPEVIGQLLTGAGPLQLKLSQPMLMKELIAYNGKTLALTGKLRNAGKYLIVTSVVGAPPPAFERKKRGGI